VSDKTAEKSAPVDAVAVLAVLAAYWADPQPEPVFGRVPKRIAGGPYDQPVPEGVSNPYWEIVRQIPCDTISAYFFGHPYPLGDPMRLLTDRHALCGTFSWAICSPGSIAWIAERLDGNGIVEPGAGAGYWAWQLAQAGVDVAAYEPKDVAGNHHVDGDPWFPLLRGDHEVTAQHPDRSLLLCWPTYGDPWAEQALAAYKGSQLFYIGEGHGGCCADDGFFERLRAEWEEAGDCPAHVSYSGIHCNLTEYRRKGCPR
jgi:hypothetical protein